MSTRQRPELGQWCTVNYTCRKWRVDNMTRWHRGNKAGMRMLFIGWRIVHEVDAYPDTEFDYNGDLWSENWAIKHKESKEVWLFVHNARQKPVYAFPADVETE